MFTSCTRSPLYRSSIVLSLLSSCQQSPVLDQLMLALFTPVESIVIFLQSFVLFSKALSASCSAEQLMSLENKLLYEECVAPSLQ